jgi:hypothetical protein
MAKYGAIKWQPTRVLREAYDNCVEAMTSGRVLGRDWLDCFEFAQALERELVARGAIEDVVTKFLSSVAADLTNCREVLQREEAKL